jgi:hypothetical protein
MANEIEFCQITFRRGKILIRRFAEPYRGLSIVIEGTVFIDVQNAEGVLGCRVAVFCAQLQRVEVGRRR